MNAMIEDKFETTRSMIAPAILEIQKADLAGVRSIAPTPRGSTASALELHTDLIRRLVAKGGPNREEYAILDAWIANIYRMIESGQISRDNIPALRAAFGEAFSSSTIQGFAFSKPHGYAGDYQIIDRIYEQFVTCIPHLSNWDAFWQSHAAPCAVRNRKTYFLNLLKQRASERGERGPFHILNVASGPGRDILEHFLSNPTSQTFFHCVEQDPQAIGYASNLCKPYLDRISFIQTDVLRFRPRRKYDLIWSAGLFDYFSDRVFKVMLNRLLAAIAPDGEIIIGNFAPGNPSKHWMAFCEWNLHYRSPSQLVSLAEACGVNARCCSIGHEPEGINLFLHIRQREESQAP
jgi:extracellular factor (EF) 3-hydroxypalmitic acid methyl ester biosynthesis protein